MTAKKPIEAQAEPVAVDEATAEQLKNLRATLDETLARNEELTAENESLKAQLHKSSTGRSGWIVRTPNAGYNGTTAGVVFRSGMAFLPDNEEGTNKAHYLAAEFGYMVAYTQDYQEHPIEAEQINKSLIESLMIPDRR